MSAQGNGDGNINLRHHDRAPTATTISTPPPSYVIEWISWSKRISMYGSEVLALADETTGGATGG